MKTNKILKWLLLIFFFLGAIFITREVNKFIDIDRCLDRGSAWDYEHGFCLNQTDHK